MIRKLLKSALVAKLAGWILSRRRRGGRDPDDRSDEHYGGGDGRR